LKFQKYHKNLEIYYHKFIAEEVKIVSDEAVDKIRQNRSLPTEPDKGN